ncbi:MAG TPA: thiol:disulfide interchange protein DsbA/DsbL [Burkholderiales bacterium]|nr:thiol:disulfide interchange protein DsbA/DsbL [Burkholderiales bacterium]
MKKLFAALAAFAVAIPVALAQGNFQYTELKPAQPVETDGKKIEVLEFFWYGCIHCYNLEPVLEPWVKKLPADTQFRRVPAVFNQRWAHDAVIYYTMEAMGLLDKLHRPLFDAIHRDKLDTANEKALTQFLQKHGVDAKKFLETMKSFGVQSKTRRAVQLTTAYKIDGTPAMAVQGRYTVSADQGRSREGMLETVNHLVEQVRKGK